MLISVDCRASEGSFIRARHHLAIFVVERLAPSGVSTSFRGVREAAFSVWHGLLVGRVCCVITVCKQCRTKLWRFEAYELGQETVWCQLHTDSWLAMVLGTT
jgi:hypothetical protein